MEDGLFCEELRGVLDDAMLIKCSGEDFVVEN